MPERPFDVIDCSWPRPVECSAGWWASEPHWDAPLSMMTPQPNWQMLQGHLCWSIDWRAFFRAGIVPWERDFGGEMRGFHVVFRIRVNHAGKLAFWADDGCMIRRNGEILNEDRSAHTPLRREVDVECGDVLQIAQWQKDGEWVWGAEPLSGSGAEPTMDCLWPYYEAVLQKIQAPNGPPLKMYSHAVMPFRMILSAYSLILNGYVPSDVLLYGEHQWSGGARHILSSFVPFANIVSTDEVNARIRAYGGADLVDRAMQNWWVMKTLVSLLCPPDEFCAMDDDVLILEDTTDALTAFQHHDLVFATDIDHGEEYRTAWEPAFGRNPLNETGKFNAGLYWMRNQHDPAMIGDFALRVPPGWHGEYVWEQGFVASLFADRNTFRLPSQRYFYPLFDGLPGGMLGYDYRSNPSGFASIHFGGLREKPTDAVCMALVPDVLRSAATS